MKKIQNMSFLTNPQFNCRLSIIDLTFHIFWQCFHFSFLQNQKGMSTNVNTRYQWKISPIEHCCIIIADCKLLYDFLFLLIVFPDLHFTVFSYFSCTMWLKYDNFHLKTLHCQKKKDWLDAQQNIKKTDNKWFANNDWISFQMSSHW